MQRTLSLFAALMAMATFAVAAPPLAGQWNIATSGTAASSGDLAFRVTPGDGGDPVDITVPVMAGAAEDSVARSIYRALGAQLGRDRYRVELGQGSNVLVSDPRGRPNFSLELVDADVESIRVAVQSVTPAASPTVPPQSAPADTPAGAIHDEAAPGNGAPGTTVPPPPPPASPSGAAPRS
jgi:hypothetical protein